MKDNFDLKKFLTENKTIENSNPFLKEAKEKEEKFNKSKLEKAIKAVLKKEGGASGLKPLIAVAKDLGAEKKDLIDVLKKMSSVEKHRHGDYILKENLQSKIREMIINELSGDMDPYDEDLDDPETIRGNYGDNEIDDESYYQHSHQTDIELEEAKEDEEEIETDESEDTEEAPEEDSEEKVESEETEEVDTESEGGIEDIAADMKGDEGDLMDHLISALKVSKGMDNEKLTTQIGNTLKFFVGEYIGGEE
jgi:hypothetical protein